MEELEKKISTFLKRFDRTGMVLPSYKELLENDEGLRQLIDEVKEKMNTTTSPEEQSILQNNLDGLEEIYTLNQYTIIKREKLSQLVGEVKQSFKRKIKGIFTRKKE